MTLAKDNSQIETGIYIIRNIRTSRVYVGSAAKSLTARWKDHRVLLRRKKHPNRHLQFSWNKYGEDSFEFQILEKCAPDLCLEREQHWIDFYWESVEGIYNIFPTAGSPFGHRWTLTPEQRKMVIERNRKAVEKRKENKEWKANVIKSNREKAKRPEEKERLRKMSSRAARLSAMSGASVTAKTLALMKVNKRMK